MTVTGDALFICRMHIISTTLQNFDTNAPDPNVIDACRYSYERLQQYALGKFTEQQNIRQAYANAKQEVLQLEASMVSARDSVMSLWTDLKAAAERGTESDIRILEEREGRELSNLRQLRSKLDRAKINMDEACQRAA